MRALAAALLIACSASGPGPATATATATATGTPDSDPDADPAADSAADPAADSIAADVVAEGGEPLRLPVTGDGPAWLEEPLGAEARRATYTASTVASGARSSVVKTAAGQYVAFNVELGAVGVLEPPARVVWLGFGAADRLLAADADGNLYVARGLDRWDRRGRVAGAKHWDAAPGIIAASDGTSVVASTDGGRTWSKPFEPRRKVRRVLVRVPRTVVVEADGGKTARIWISADGGGRFSASRLRPEALTRTGPWIWSDDWRCPAVLAADNRTWVEPTTRQQNRAMNTHSWSAFLQTTTVLEGYDKVPDFATPDYPALLRPGDGERRIRGANPCPPPSAGVEGGVAGGVLGGILGGIAGHSCQGAGCLRSNPAPRPDDTATGFYLLRDARCATERSTNCRADLPPRRPPHTSRVDHRRGTVIALGDVPAGCHPASVLSARGLGVLLCRDGAERTAIWVADRGGAWVREHVVSAAADTFWNHGVAADGTLLLQRTCPWKATSCAATIRRPVAVGSKSAWYDLDERGALTYRPVVGGRALIAGAGRDGGVVLSLAAGSDRRVTLTESYAPAFELHGLAIDERGRVRVDGRASRRRISRFLTADGRTAPAEPPKLRRTRSGAIITTPRPIDPSHVPGR